MTRLRQRASVAIRRAAFIILALGFAIAELASAPAFPPLAGRIVDQANILDTEVKSRLNAKLEELEVSTTNQFVIVTLQSLNGQDIAEYGYQLGRHWGIGRAGRNNGVLLIVAPSERKVRIEVGYGLEGSLTDAVTRLIIANSILPRFRIGDFSGGIQQGADDILKVLAGDAENFKKRAAERDSRPTSGEGLSSFSIVFIILAIWLFVFLRRARNRALIPRRRSIWGWGIPTGGMAGSGWGTGGRSGGGFSGGGGSFGGGGSSGSW